jgi:hypothetical protein
MDRLSVVHSGHPAYSTLFDKIKQQLLIFGVKGVQHPSDVVAFLVSLIKVLYSLTTFWKTFSHRNCALPEYFEGTQGANNYVARKQKVWTALFFTIKVFCSDPLMHLQFLSKGTYFDTRNGHEHLS